MLTQALIDLSAKPQIEWYLLRHSRDFTTNIADYLSEDVSWESIGVAVERIDFNEEWYCFLYGSNKNIE